jgi:hypothetical protein
MQYCIVRIELNGERGSGKEGGSQVSRNDARQLLQVKLVVSPRARVVRILGRYTRSRHLHPSKHHGCDARNTAGQKGTVTRETTLIGNGIQNEDS